MNKLIFIVEDDPEIREALTDVLSDYGYDVMTAGNGREALEMLLKADRLPQLVLLDLMMPEMDGFAFRDEQIKDPRLAAIPTAVLSADGNVQVKALRARVTEYLRKPIDVDRLVAVANKYCG